MDIIIIILLSVLAGVIGGMGGPSGFIPIAALLTLTTFTQTQVSGTISASFLIATLFGAALYTISGDQNWKLLIFIIPSALIGTQVGTYINTQISEIVFLILLSGVAITLGILLLKWATSGLEKLYSLDITTLHSKLILISLGLIVGIIGGITGIGGIAIVVPVLLLLGVNPLTSIATGITQGVFTTLGTSFGYFSQGAIQFEYVLYIGVPFAVSQIIGWKIAHLIDTDKLKLSLGIFNTVFGIYLLTTVIF